MRLFGDRSFRLSIHLPSLRTDKTAMASRTARLAPLAAFAVLRPLEGDEDDRIAARALRAREIPEPLPVEAT